MNSPIRQERRKEPRAPSSENIRLQWTEGGSARWVLGRCLDISPKGMCVQLKDTIGPSQLVQFELARANYRGSATVRNSTKKGQWLRIGLEIVASVRPRAM